MDIPSLFDLLEYINMGSIRTFFLICRIYTHPYGYGRKDFIRFKQMPWYDHQLLGYSFPLVLFFNNEVVKLGSVSDGDGWILTDCNYSWGKWHHEKVDVGSTKSSSDVEPRLASLEHNGAAAQIIDQQTTECFGIITTLR